MRNRKVQVVDIIFLLVFTCSFSIALIDKELRDEFHNLALTSVGAYWGVNNQQNKKNKP